MHGCTDDMGEPCMGGGGGDWTDPGNAPASEPAGDWTDPGTGGDAVGDACQACLDSCGGDAGCEESCSYGPCSNAGMGPQGEPMMGGDGTDHTDPGGCVC